MGPSNFPQSEEERFFDNLRQRLDDDEVAPDASAWPVISQAVLPPETPRRYWPVPLAGLIGILAGLLIGWWASQSVATSEAPQYSTFQHTQPPATARRATTGGEPALANRPTKPSITPDQVLGIRTVASTASAKAPRHRRLPATYASQPAPSQPVRTQPLVSTNAASLLIANGPEAGSSAAAEAASPSPSGAQQWLTALAQDSAIRHEQGRAVNSESTAANRLDSLITAQRATLQALQTQLDSLKRALPTEPPLLAAPVGPAPDSARVRQPTPAPQPWALTALAETTTGWGSLPGYDPQTTTEDLRAPVTQGLRLERRLNDRWELRLGVADTRVQGQFRYTSDRSTQRLTTDTSFVTWVEAGISIDSSYIIRRSRVLRLDPVINGAGQVIGYDSVWLPRFDTTYQVVISHDTIRRTETTVLTRLETLRQTHRQQLRPEYRFWSIPFSAQFSVLRWRRWNAGLSAGAQVTIFRSGQQPRLVGDTYELRRISAGDSPFRPVSLALTSALEVRYQLTDRLDLLGGASVRGWALSPVRNDARVQLTPGALLGIRWGFGGR